METGTAWTPPSHVPLALLLKEDPWGDLGARPHMKLAQMHSGGAVRYTRNHPLPGLAPHGTWVVVGAREMRSVLIDNKSFASRGTTGVGPLIGEDLILAPLESDPPDHARMRGILQPLFTPLAIGRYRERVDGLTRDLIRDLVPRGACDFVRDFAEKLPTQIFLHLMGLPQSRLPQFLLWEDAIMGRQPEDKMFQAWRELRAYLADTIVERRGSPSDDVLSQIVTTTFDGQPISDREALGMAMILFAAGLDTVVTSLSWQFRYLAENPSAQERLRRDPALIPAAVEELLRAFSFTTTTRIATCDVEVGGVVIKRGDVVACPTMLGSLDPSDYQNPPDVDLDRGAKRHFAFGFGPHICLGMHLARMELSTAIELWLSEGAPFRLPMDYSPPCHGGVSLGLDELRLIW